MAGKRTPKSAKRATKRSTSAKKQPAKKAARKKAPAKRTQQRAPLVAQPHGGALQVGNPGNAGGPGRPPSVIRQQLRGSFDDRIRVLESIADGEPVQRTQVPFLAVLAHAKCPRCGDQLKAEGALDELLELTIDAKVSAAPRDRLSAIDMMGKYSLGTVKEVTVESVRERLVETLRIVRDTLPAALAEDVIRQLEPVWS